MQWCVGLRHLYFKNSLACIKVVMFLIKKWGFQFKVIFEYLVIVVLYFQLSFWIIYHLVLSEYHVFVPKVCIVWNVVFQLTGMVSMTMRLDFWDTLSLWERPCVRKSWRNTMTPMLSYLTPPSGPTVSWWPLWYLPASQVKLSGLSTCSASKIARFTFYNYPPSSVVS